MWLRQDVQVVIVGVLELEPPVMLGRQQFDIARSARVHQRVIWKATGGGQHNAESRIAIKSNSGLKEKTPTSNKNVGNLMGAIQHGQRCGKTTVQLRDSTEVSLPAGVAPTWPPWTYKQKRLPVK